MSVTVRNTTGGQPVPQPPTRADGQPYGFEMIHGRWRTYADTPVELVTALIPGYTELDAPVERMQARVRHAVDVQVVLQAELATSELLDRFRGLVDTVFHRAADKAQAAALFAITRWQGRR